MSEELEVVGLVQHKNEDKAKGKYGIKLGDRWYNGFGVLPDYVIEGAKVKLLYFEKKVGDKTYFNVVDGGVNQADETEEVSPKATQTSLNPHSPDYKPGNDIDHITDVVDGSAIVWGKCLDAIEKTMGRKPEKEEMACVNSLFIEVCKRLK